MTDPNSGTKPGKGLVWAGRVVSALPVLLLTMSAVMKFSGDPEMLKGFTGMFGYPADTLVPIGVVELACVVLYAIPHTAVLGAVLLTGYLGGAIATHVRIDDTANIVSPVIAGVLVWLGLWLRDRRVRDLLPLRRP